MDWYLIHTKPRQEKSALLNLEQQGYECYLPLFSHEKIQQGNLSIVEEPLFPRYMFIRLHKDRSAKSWSPIRSTKGVSRLVSFGTNPAQISNELIETIRIQEKKVIQQPRRLFALDEPLVLVGGAFAGLNAVYKMPSGESRVMVLVELLSKPVPLHVAPVNLRKLN